MFFSHELCKCFQRLLLLLYSYSFIMVIKVCSHSREVTQCLNSFSTDIFVQLLKLNLLLVFRPNISTSLLKSANLKPCSKCKHHFIMWHYYFLKTTLFVANSYWIYIPCKFLLVQYGWKQYQNNFNVLKVYLDDKINKLASSESISEIKALVQEQSNLTDIFCVMIDSFSISISGIL